MADYPVVDVSVCRDARTAIQDGLKALAAHVKREPGAIPTIVDGVVADVRAARARAAELTARGEEDGNERLLLVAQRYDEMIITAQVRLLELGVKAAANEQQAIDRQMHIAAWKEGRAPKEVPEVSVNELAKLQQRQQLLAAAKEAEFREK